MGNNGANASTTMKVRKETTVKQILEDAAGQLGMGHEFSKNLCLMYPRDADIANAGEKIGVELTVEQANLFNHRPRLCKLNVITDEYVNRLVEKLKNIKEIERKKMNLTLTLKLKIGWTNLRTKYPTKLRSKSLLSRAGKADPVGNLLREMLNLSPYLQRMTIEKAKLRQ